MVVSRFEEALKILRLWEESIPGEATANYRIARIQEHLSQPAEAEAEYKKAIAKEPLNYRSVYNLARILLDQRRSDEALVLFKKCNHGPSALAAKAGMARCYKTQGENEIARSLLQDVLKSSYEDQLKSFRAVDEIPARFVAASELGCLETELGDFSEARKYLESALEFFPLDSIARYSYAVALRGLGLQKEAEENFAITRAARASLDQVSVLQEKLRIDPQDTNSRIRIGKIILEHESERTGLFWLQSVFSYDATNSEAHEAIATYFENKRDRTPDDEKRIAYHRSFIEKK
jgi:tetratricopeptide (TPR) repeat protein